MKLQIRKFTVDGKVIWTAFATYMGSGGYGSSIYRSDAIWKAMKCSFLGRPLNA